MQRSTQGHFRKVGQAAERYSIFLPPALPPTPALAQDSNLSKTLSSADQMLGRLDGLSRILPHPDLLIHFYIRKEAVLSSQIEGTQSTLSELLLYEIEPSRGANGDVVDVSNYVRAMRHGLSRLREQFPLSLRLIREMHGMLLERGRGSGQTPGEFRTSQNWIGGSRPGNAAFVPPPVKEMQDALHALEIFVHTGATEFPALIQCALIHLQFESIHPFLDGNGRIGRLLITLLLVERGVLVQPMLYMSLYLKQNRETYYRLLQSVRVDGDWEQWILFFLEGVRLTAQRAVELATNVLELFRRDETRMIALRGRRGSALRVLSHMQRAPYFTTASVKEKTGLSYNTVLTVVETFIEMGILKEEPAWGRGRLFQYKRYLELLEEGTHLK